MEENKLYRYSNKFLEEYLFYAKQLLESLENNIVPRYELGICGNIGELSGDLLYAHDSVLEYSFEKLGLDPENPIGDRWCNKWEDDGLEARIDLLNKLIDLWESIVCKKE